MAINAPDSIIDGEELKFQTTLPDRRDLKARMAPDNRTYRCRSGPEDRFLLDDWPVLLYRDTHTV